MGELPAEPIAPYDEEMSFGRIGTMHSTFRGGPRAREIDSMPEPKAPKRLGGPSASGRRNLMIRWTGVAFPKLPGARTLAT